MNKYDDLAKIIIKNVGGRSNIIRLTHCVTRLRFFLRDESKVKTEVLKNTSGIVTVIRSGEQYMVVIGSHVTDVYDAVCACARIEEDGSRSPSAKRSAGRFLPFLINLFRRERSVSADPDAFIVYAPTSGKIKPLEKIEDPGFSSGVLGKGCAIEPSGDEIRAPFDGRITQVAASKHAIAVRSENSTELLIHIGMDTVELKGLGFSPLVQEGDLVKKGQLLLKFNRAAIAAAGYCVTTPVVVTNAAEHTRVDFLASGTVTEGQALLAVY